MRRKYLYKYIQMRYRDWKHNNSDNNNNNNNNGN